MSFGARAAVRLDALSHNFEILKSAVPGSKVMVAVKANAYGLGVEPVAAALASAGAARFGVAELSEALELAGTGLPVQILGGVLPDEIPAALEAVITEDNAAKIKAKYICEVANGPVLASAEPVLEKKGIMIIPDVLANAGGVTVSYFEWVQNRQGLMWTLEEVRARLEKMMCKAFDEVWDTAEREKQSLRGGAYTLAFRRIERGINSHGTREFFNGH